MVYQEKLPENICVLLFFKMKLIKKLIINISSIVGLIFPWIFLTKKNKKKPRLTIYNLHSTSKKYHNTYRKILEKINKKEKFIDPKNLNKFFKHNFGEESFSLLTLDDGFDNNFEFANTILSQLNIKAIFFIIPDSININERNNKDFFRLLYPSKQYKWSNKLIKDFLPLSSNKIISLKDDGHTIGMHGFTHENFGKLNEYEIIRKIDLGLKIFKELNLEIEHFAYPFGNKKSFTNKSNRILGKYFKYIHIGLRGFNFINKDIKAKILYRHPLSTHGKSLRYYPISQKELNFFSFNRISLLINYFTRI